MIREMLLVVVLVFSANAFADSGLSLERYTNLMAQISKDMPELKGYDVVVVETVNKGWGSHGVEVVLVSPDLKKKVGVRYVFTHAHPIPFHQGPATSLKNSSN